MISIIVPIFGVEPFLDVCVLSLIHQTYTDLEIILVDDGSPDCCDKICDHYAALDPRIRVIHKKRSGPSDARNAGLKVARGEYIGFVDSDDYVAGNMFSTLLNLLNETGSDIAICGHAMTSNRGKPYPYLLSHKTRVMDSTEAIRRMLQVGQYESFVWNKLYKRELFDQIRFPSGHLYEDLYTMYKILDKADKIVYTKEVKYYYRQRLGSIIHTKYSAKYFDYVQASVEVRDFVKTKYPGIYGTANFAYYRARAFTFLRILTARPQMLFNPEVRREEIYKYIRYIVSAIR